VAIYHLSAKIISRGQGRGIIAAAAYRAGARLRDRLLGEWHDYTKKQGVGHRAILLPDGAPEDWLDRETLWNAVESAERRRDAQLAREVEIALPRELSEGEAIRLAEDFVRTEFVARGMVADIAIHWGKTRSGEAQPHAHVLLTLRKVADGRFGPKERDWNETDLLRHWREAWAGLANARLAESGHDVRIDHRSHEALGLDLMPQVKLGGCIRRREAAGEETERGTFHREDQAVNGAKIIANPGLALAAITVQQSTFTRHDIARFLHGHTVNAEQFQNALAAVEASPLLVRLGRDGRGVERYTTREMLALERGLAATALTLAGKPGHGVAPQLCRGHAEAAGLGAEQVRALGHITGGGDLAAVVGHAGTGKSTLLGAARALWVAAGYRVRGAALSGIAAEGLQQGARIASRTIASLLRQWEQGQEKLSARDVLVVDEAGMVGSRDLAALLAAVRAAGAKLVLVGDPEQLQPIAAGAPFRAIVARVGAAELTTVRRQTAAWQCEATEALATGHTTRALMRYQKEGMVVGHAGLDDAKAALIAVWNDRRRCDPEASQILLAHRRVDVRDLNQRARALRHERGELGPDIVLPTRDGKKPFAVGERVYFLRNERSLGVRNGTLGTLLRIEGGGPGANLVVRLDDAREVTFSLKNYDAIDHGYAATVHKAQGVTVEHAYVLASRSMDRHLTYVALSRHRKSVHLHWSRDEIGDVQRLRMFLSRERRKESTLDYGEAEVPEDATGACFAVRRGLAPDSAILAVLPSRAAVAKPAFNGVRRRQPSLYDVAANAVEQAAAAAWEGGRTQAGFAIARIADAGQHLGQAVFATAVLTVAKTQQTTRPMVKAPTAAKVSSKGQAAKAQANAPGQKPVPKSVPKLWFGGAMLKLTSAISGVMPSSAPSPLKAAVAKRQQTARPTVKLQPVAKAPAVPSSAPMPPPKPAAPPQPRPDRAPSLAAMPLQPVRPMAAASKPPGPPSSPPPEPTKPQSPPVSEAATSAADVAETLSRYEAVFEESARGERQLAATWQGSAAEEKELARLITRAWQAARAIAGNPALLAAFREQNPDLALWVERFSKRDRDQLIARARRQMPQPSPEAKPDPEPEQPTLGMRM